MSENKYLYRYESYRNVSCDEYDTVYRGSMKMKLYTYNIIKETKCGCWIFTGYHLVNRILESKDVSKEYQKFVNLTCNKKFACRTIEDAKESFIARKKRQIRILTSQLDDAKEALNLISLEINS